MGGCHSSAALDPVEATGGAAPVFWSPEKEQEKRAARLHEIQLKQREEIERATGHLRRPPSTDRRRTSSTATPPPGPTEAEEKTRADGTSSPAAVTAPPTPNSSAPASPVVSPHPPARHFRGASAQSPSAVISPSSTTSSSTAAAHTRRTSAPVSQRRPVRKADWDYDGLPGARPAGLPPHQRSASLPETAGEAAAVAAPRLYRAGMDSVGEAGHAREEKEQVEEAPVKAEAAPVLARPTSSEASAAFGVKLRSTPRVVRPAMTEAPVVGAAVAS